MPIPNGEILNELYKQAINGNPQALDELSKNAFGGDVEARRLILKLDNEKITSPHNSSEKKYLVLDERLEKILKLIPKPINNLLEIKARQILVGCDTAQAPVGSTTEEFPKLRINEAATLLGKNKKNGGGVPLEAWTPESRNRLIHGQRPVGHPEHPNV